MKLTQILEVLSAELKISDLKEINKALKNQENLKFRITSKALGHFGFTGQIKSVSEEGVKIFKSNKVSLVPLDEIETFGKAKPREARPERKPEEKKAAAKSGAKPKFAKDDDDDGFEFKKKKTKSTSTANRGGSRFIPNKK